jgi:hypothetical protein
MLQQTTYLLQVYLCCIIFLIFFSNKKTEPTPILVYCPLLQSPLSILVLIATQKSDMKCIGKFLATYFSGFLKEHFDKMATGVNKLNKITINFFYRENSPDCQITRRALYSILDSYLGNIIIQEINFDQNKIICDAYKVYGVPTLLIIKNDQILNRYSGILDSCEIGLLLKSVIESIQD